MNNPGNQPIPLAFTADKFPSLDGIRAICIALVLFAHLANAYTFDETTRMMITRLGLLGVQIFFVLSGFLITTLLLKDKKETGKISLKNFYIRRAFRILPVVILYLTALLILNAVINFGVPFKSFAGALLFLSNHPWFHSSWYTAHFWSLSIEEQYYLIFPFFLKKVTAKAHLFIVLLLLIIIVIKSFPIPASLPFLHSVMLLIYQSDAVLIGSLMSILSLTGRIPLHLVRQCSPLVIIPIILLIIIFTMELVPILYPLNSTISSCLVSFLLLFVMLNNGNLLYRFLNSKYMILIGKLSFSIYVWQQLFTSSDGRLGSFARLPKNILLIALVSSISYFLFEKRFLKLKEKFASGRK